MTSRLERSHELNTARTVGLFVILGVGLFVAEGLWSANRPSARPDVPIVIPAHHLAQVLAAYRDRYGTDPEPKIRARLVDGLVDDALLYREAVDRGLQVADPRVARRLLLKMKYVGEVDDDVAATLDRAFRLGMADDDVVVRRMLVHDMRVIAGGSDLRAVSDRELEDYLRANGERWKRPSLTTLRHVFVEADGDTVSSSARAQVSAEQRAGEILRRIKAEAIPLPDALRLGDHFVGGHEVKGVTARRMAGRFGDGFARVVSTAAVGAWTGPVRSSYGWHLVWVESRVPERAPRLEEVRSQVALALAAELRDARVEEFLARLRERATVTLEGGSTVEGDSPAGLS